MKRTLVLILAATLAVSATVNAGWRPSAFIRGDADRSGTLNVSDALAVIGHLYAGQTKVDLDCLAAADANGDDVVNLSDPIFILNYLFLQGERPPAPFPEAGTAPVDAAVNCRVFVFEPPPIVTFPELPGLPDFPGFPQFPGFPDYPGTWPLDIWAPMDPGWGVSLPTGGTPSIGW